MERELDYGVFWALWAEFGLTRGHTDRFRPTCGNGAEGVN